MSRAVLDRGIKRRLKIDSLMSGQTNRKQEDQPDSQCGQKVLACHTRGECDGVYKLFGNLDAQRHRECLVVILSWGIMEGGPA